MAARLLELSPQAERDLLAIEAYLRQAAGEATAAKAIAHLVSRLEALLVFPEAAPSNPKLDGAPRTAHVRPWTIIYAFAPEANRIQVWRIVDARRDLPSFVRRLPRG